MFAKLAPRLPRRRPSTARSRSSSSLGIRTFSDVKRSPSSTAPGCCAQLALLAVGPTITRAVAVAGWTEAEAVAALRQRHT